MRILFISHRIPYPPNKGDKIRSFNIIKELSKNNEIFIASPIDQIDEFNNVDGLKKYTKDIFTNEVKPFFQKPKGLLFSIFKIPITVTYFYSSILQHKIDKFLDENNVDVVYCYSSPSAEYIYRSKHLHHKLKNSLWVMDLIDVDSQKWAQYADSLKWPMRWIYLSESKNLLTYESRIVEDFDNTILVSKTEKLILEKIIPDASTIVIPNGVDLEFFKPNEKEIHPCRIVFTGMMDYRPNIDAVTWFAKKVFPQLKKKVPDITFIIVGNRPSPRVKALSRTPGISVTGYVDDIRDYLSTATLCVVPLKIARGIQNKVLEAMAMGKTVVCTSQALEGIDATPGKQVVLADTDGEFVLKIEQLIKDTTRNQKIGRSARQFVEENFSWSKNLFFLEDLFNRGNRKRLVS